MKFVKKCQWIVILLAVMIVSVSISMSVFATDPSGESGRLIDGSFENLKSFSGTYFQFQPSATDPWKTTAEKQLIELLRENTGTYISNVTVKPSDGTYAAELNADEESSLYQIVNTEPSSLYEWGLDHGSRTASETMALIIGPNQSVLPSKNWGEGYESADLSSQNPTLRTGYKYGKDQMMQMVAWLKATGQIGSTTDNDGLANNGQAIILYSKKFAEHGGFQDNQDNQPFSLKPSAIYTEKWYIWIMTDHNTTVAGEENPWGRYGLNDKSVADDELDLNKYYLYKVPSGQDKTLFAFTSVDNSPLPGKTTPNPTYGNFLDNVNFNLYRLLSGSSTSHGSAVVGSSDGTAAGEGEQEGYEITVDHSVAIYVSDGENLTIKAKIAADERADVTFAGVYYTTQDPDGSGVITRFISSKENWSIEGTEDDSKDIVYTFDLEEVTSAVNLHFVFVKSPLITYDVNGGKEYLCTPEGSNVQDEPDNVYSFKPHAGEDGLDFIEPYTSHAPEGQNDGWKFMGWQFFDDNGVGDLLSGVHKVACNYEQKTGEGVAITQKFVVIGEDGDFEEPEKDTTRVEWNTNDEILYDDYATGLTMVAQWRWRQTFVPQVKDGKDYVESVDGGTVKVTTVTSESDENYDNSYGENGAVAYFAEVNETVNVTAIPKEGYCFEGWYDQNGDQVSSSAEMSYVEMNGAVNTYYARFTKKIPQYYKRQIQNNGTWETLSDDDNTVPVLDHTYLNEGVGTVVSSTASNNESYGLVGWFDENGNRVDDSMVCNDGKTIRYEVKKEATYFARYDKSVKVLFKMQLVNDDDSLSDLESKNNIASLSVESVDGIPGDVVKSKAYSKDGYSFVGWFDEAGNKVTELDATDAKVIKPTVTAENEKTYYARFTARTDTAYKVNHYFVDYKEVGKNYLLDSKTLYGKTGELVTPTVTPKLSLPENKGYVYSSGIEEKAISASGNTVFNLYYTKTPTVLTYVANPPEGKNAEGTVAPTSGYVGCSEKVSENAFTVTEYIFNGWNTSADGSGTSYSAGDDYLMLENNEDGNPNILYAQWVPASSVSYKVQHIKLDKENNPVTGGTYEETFYGTIGAEVTATPKTTYIGYTFDEGYADNITFGFIVDGDAELVLKLYYKPDATKLTYKANGGIGADYIQSGVVDEAVNVEANEVDGISKFTRPGYTFAGWKDPAGNPYSAGSTYTLTAGEDILLAQWIANTNTPYYVYHYKVSADGTKAELVEGESGERTGKTGTYVNAKPIEIDGYTYKSDFDTNGMSTIDHGIIAGDGSLVLKLYYIPNTVKLIYDPNGGSGSPVSKTGRYGEQLSVSGNLFSRAGYTFAGWNTENSSGAGGTSYQPNDTYTYGKTDATLYAQWTANKDTRYKAEHYKVSADGMSAVLADEEQKQGTTDDSVTALPKEYKGYVYKSDFASNGMKTVASGTIAGDGSLVLKLYYEPSETPLTYMPNGGVGENKIVMGKVDEQKEVLEIFYTREGYTFTEWNTKDDGSGTGYQAKDLYTLSIAEDVLYAQWEARTDIAYKIEHYKVNGAGTSATLADEENLIGATDSEVIAVANTYKGYTYAPLYYNKDMITVDRGRVKANGSLVLKLYYTPDETTLTYKANGGNGKDEVTAGKVDEQKNVLENMFTRKGYTFTGWNTKANGSGQNYLAGDVYTLTAGDDVLYAQWKKVAGAPEDSEKPGTSSQNTGNSGTTASLTDNSGVSNTGDASHMIRWMLLMAASAVTIVSIMLGKKSRYKK